jgi:hypothetical protein
MAEYSGLVEAMNAAVEDHGISGTIVPSFPFR